MTELYLNDQLANLQGDEAIATDYQIAPLSDISKRNGAKSISFKLPLTANNKSIIDNAHVIVNATRVPYSLLKARLYANGVDQQIQFASINEIQDEIQINLHGSNIDFFSIIKERKLKDLPHDWDHTWNLTNVSNNLTNTSGYVYALIDFHSDSPNSYIGGTSIDARKLFPSVYLHSIIDKIITEAGFIGSGDFLNNADYRNILIPCTNIKDEAFPKQFSFTDSVDFTAQFFDEIIPFVINATLPGIVVKKGSTVTITGITDTSKYITLRVPEDVELGTFVLKAFGMFEVDNISGFNYYDGTSTSNDPAIVYPVVIGDDYNITFNITLEKNTDNNIDVDYGFVYNTVFGGGSFNWTTAREFRFGTDFGSYLPVSYLLPNMKQSDLLKAIAQKFALIINVDNQKKIVYFRQFSEIIANIPNAKDWSDKVDYSEKYTIGFRSDYAQLNNCTYKDDDTVVKPIGTDAVIEISDRNLPAENDLFESPFAASEQVERMGNIAQIKIFTDGEIDNKPEPRILYATHQPFSVYNLYDGSTTLNKTVGIATHFISEDKDFNLGWDNNLLDNYYPEIISAIQNFKIVTIPLRLTAADINQLDFFTPVWIEIKGQTGAYFYISKIRQFKSTSKESTNVELVKLT